MFWAKHGKNMSAQVGVVLNMVWAPPALVAVASVWACVVGVPSFALAVCCFHLHVSRLVPYGGELGWRRASVLPSG